jgi:hypothetical protein
VTPSAVVEGDCGDAERWRGGTANAGWEVVSGAGDGSGVISIDGGRLTMTGAGAGAGWAMTGTGATTATAGAGAREGAGAATSADICRGVETPGG